MSELKLEAGKTYVFKDYEARLEFSKIAFGSNSNLIADYYKNGFHISYILSSSGYSEDDILLIAPLELQYFKLKEEENTNMTKQIKPEDEITITTTYGQLAKIYAVMGHINGESAGRSLWLRTLEILDPTREVYDAMIINKTPDEVVKYASYQKEWENLLFNKESDTQRKVRELREQAEQLLSKAKELENGPNAR